MQVAYVCIWCNVGQYDVVQFRCNLMHEWSGGMDKMVEAWEQMGQTIVAKSYQTSLSKQL